MMISFEKRYFSMNRVIMLAVGLWPYQQTKIVRFQVTFFLGILISFIIFQLSRLFFVECTFDFAIRIRILCVLLYFTLLTVTYINFLINVETMKHLLERLQYTYNDLKDKNEIAIYNKYGNIGKRITFAFIVIAVCSFVILTMLQTWSNILDVIVPSNETYANHFKIMICRYFVLQEKYFYLFLLHLNAVITIGSIALLSAGVTLFSFFKHICGMFRIASYRLERAIRTRILQNISLKNEIMIYKEIIYAVDIHRKAMEFTKLFINAIGRSALPLIIITVLCLSFSLYEISRMESFTAKTDETLLHLLIFNFTLVSMFLINYVTQEVTDYNNHVFFTAYNVPWYQAPLHIQKLILFLIQRGSKALIWKVGGVFAGSLECFASLASTSVSYFTVMLSFQ
ncbi:Or9e26 [Eciton burchellii]|nr:Or9e26 [Eciton burchellii]